MTQNAIDFFADLLRGMRDQISHKSQSNDDGMSQESSHMPDVADRASMESDRNLRLLFRERDLQLMREIQKALERLENGEYGICEECGEDIDPARLKAQPTATLCLLCKTHLEEEKAYQRNSHSQAMFSFSA